MDFLDAILFMGEYINARSVLEIGIMAEVI